MALASVVIGVGVFLVSFAMLFLIVDLVFTVMLLVRAGRVGDRTITIMMGVNVACCLLSSVLWLLFPVSVGLLVAADSIGPDRGVPNIGKKYWLVTMVPIGILSVAAGIVITFLMVFVFSAAAY